MSKPTQIGWYTLKADKVFRNTYECAAWYEDVLVKAGKYPVVVYDLRVLEHQDRKYNGMIEGRIDGTYTHMDGTIVSDEFGARFFGVPVGDYDNSKNAGKPSSHSMMVYMYEVADSVLNDPESPWELFPEYAAKAIQGEWDGKPYTTHAIYKAGSSGAAKKYYADIYHAGSDTHITIGEYSEKELEKSILACIKQRGFRADNCVWQTRVEDL